MHIELLCIAIHRCITVLFHLYHAGKLIHSLSKLSKSMWIGGHFHCSLLTIHFKNEENAYRVCSDMGGNNNLRMYQVINFVRSYIALYL